MCYFEPHIKTFTPLFYLCSTAVSIIYECNKYWFYTRTPQKKYPMYHKYRVYEYPVQNLVIDYHKRQQIKWLRLQFFLCVILQWYHIRLKKIKK
jgi:hypothetical protein